MESQESIPISINKFLLRIGVISIERTKETKENGKYILVVQNKRQDLVQQKVEIMFETIKDRNLHGVKISQDKFGLHPLIQDQIVINRNA